MSIATASNVDEYLAAFRGLAAGAFQGEPAWLNQRREQAIERFGQLGFPTSKDEEWRLVNLAPVTRRPYRLTDAASALKWDDVKSATIPDLAGPRIVFLDGRLSLEDSRLEGFDSVEVMPLKDAISRHGDLIETHLGKYAPIDDQPFTALNAALWTEGAFVRIRKEAALEQPIELAYVSTGADGTMSHPRTLIVAERHSNASVIEYHISNSDEEYFSNGVTEVVVEDNAKLAHYWVELEGPKAINVSTLDANLGRDSRLESHTMLFGGALVRNNVHPVLDGEGGDCLVNGLYLGRDRQHLDNHMRIEHAKPHCSSRQFYKGVLDDRSTGVFTGRIVVHPDAQKTDAKQSNMNLLLSRDAEADSKPQLEIYADDVKCTHGSTIGQIDEEAIFYLRSRGIDLQEARKIMVHAFAAESLERVESPAIRQYLESQLNARLPGGE